MVKRKTIEEVISLPYPSTKDISILSGWLSRSILYMKRKNNITRLNVVLDKEENSYTDGTTVHIGMGMPLILEAKNPREKIALVMGLFMHEFGHAIYTPFSLIRKAHRYMSIGMFWPATPEEAEPAIEYMKESDANCTKAFTIFKHLINILEDARIEELMLIHFQTYGRFIAGLKFLRKKMHEDFPQWKDEKKSIMAEESEAEKRLKDLLNTLLQFSRFNAVKGATKEDYRSSDVLQALLDVSDDVLRARAATNAEDFFKAVNRIFVAVFADFIKPALDEIPQNNAESGCEEIIEESGGLGGLSIAELSVDTAGAEEETKKLKEEAEKEAQRRRSFGESEEKEEESKPSNKEGAFYGEGINGPNFHIERTETDSISGEGDEGHLIFTEEDAEEIYSLDINAAAETLDEAQEREWDESLQAPQGIDFGEANRGISLTVKRINAPYDEEAARKAYDTYEKYISVGRAAAKLLKPYVNPKNTSKWEKGHYSGKKFNASKAANPNMKHFSQKKTMVKTPSISIAILIDESGSMYGGKIEIARATAIALYEMCLGLNVRFAVFGHTTNPDGVELSNYCMFDEKSSDTSYKMLNIAAKNSNRDGAAIRYVGELLYKEKTDRKLLFVISDGQPADYGYMGTAAEADVSDAVRKYSRKKVQIIAAAIDEDKESIKHMYGAEKFLDITKIEELPAKLVRIVKRSMLHR